MVRERITKQLSEADGQLVRVTRRKGWDVLDGVIVAAGPKWLVLALEYDAAFYGHAIIRTRDVKKIAAQPPSFARRALESEGHWPMPTLDKVDISGSTRTLIANVTTRDRPLAFHREALDPDACLIGRPIKTRRRKFDLQTIDTLAQWESDPSKIAYRDLTRIDVNDPYVTRLHRISGPQPSSLDPAR